MKPKILMLGAGALHIKTIVKIRNAGFTVLTVDRDPNAPGHEFSDGYSVIDLVDKMGVLNYAKKEKVDGIMPVSDFGTRAAFYASQKLNLISPTYLSGVCGNDKGMMRDVWQHDKLPQPKYYVFSQGVKLSDITDRIPFPLVVKPTDSGGGGRGVSIANNERELEEAIRHALPYAKNDRMIAEEFIEGIEVTVDSLVYQGNVKPLAISDKVKPESRYRVATSLNFPANFPKEVIERIKQLTIRATEALGVANGATHAELIVAPDQKDIRLVEMGVRGGGGHLFGTIIEEVTGISAPIQLANILCGKKPDLEIKKNSGCVYRFFNPPSHGIFHSVVYDETIVKQPYVVAFGLMIRPGQRFEGLSDSLKRVGFVVTNGATREEAILNADRVESSISYRFDAV
jgi:biotin carboxylase